MNPYGQNPYPPPGAPQGYPPGPQGYPPGPQGFPPGGFRPAAPPPKKGMSGCLLAFLIVSGLGVLVAVGVGFMVWRELGGVLGGFKELAEVMTKAASAPGTKELKAAGCEQAFVIDTKELERVVNKFEKEIAKKENREPKPMDVAKEGSHLVQCTAKAGKKLTCDELAKTFVDATDPDDSFLVTMSGGGADCSVSYSKDGKKLGNVDAPTIPQQPQ